MSVIRVVTCIRAPAEKCFDLARDVDAHLRSTASTGERIVAGKSSGLLELHDEITFEARHLGVRQRLSSKIVEYDRPRQFADQMTKGAFARLRHEHLFEEHGDVTTMTDVLDFASPFGPIGLLVDKVFLERYMHKFLVQRGLQLKEEAEIP